MQPVLLIQQLSKSFQSGVPVLQDLSFQVTPGQSVALVGANGAGKSTLIKMILGLVAPTSGSGKLFGYDLGSPEACRRLGYLPEMPGYWGELSAQELLGSMGQLRGLPAQIVKKRSASLRKILGLAQRGDRAMAGYSKGMLQRAGVAQMLLHDPEFLILDEPMSGLDPRAQEKLREILRELRRQGKTLLISSHSLEDIRSLCDSVLVLEKSHLVENGPTSEVLSKLVEKYRSSEPWDDDPLGEWEDFRSSEDA